MKKNQNTTGMELEAMVDRIKKLYEAMIQESKTKGNEEAVKKTVEELLMLQKKDGSFSVIDDYNCDSDIRVYYAYMPTYYATAALICADLYFENGLDKSEADSLKRGLHFAIGRQLVGHGFDATQTLIDTLRLYAKAGMYQWIDLKKDFSTEFKEVIDMHYQSFVVAIETKHTFSDWNKNFAEEFAVEVTEYEKYNPAYVWYAAYGSNINSERFMIYINACSDKSEPIESKPYIFTNEMYFGGNSRLWGGSVAFLDLEKKGFTYGKLYLIKKSQFEEIQQMEGSAYSKRVYMGVEDDKPVYSFTSETRKDGRMMPSAKYIETILAGLKNCYSKSEIALETYLYTRGFISEEDKLLLQMIRNSEHAITLDDLVFYTGICKTKVAKSIKELNRCGLIVQDGRTRNLKLDDDRAMVYTNKEKRDVVDILTVLDLH